MEAFGCDERCDWWSCSRDDELSLKYGGGYPARIGLVCRRQDSGAMHHEQNRHSATWSTDSSEEALNAYRSPSISVNRTPHFVSLDVQLQNP